MGHISKVTDKEREPRILLCTFLLSMSIVKSFLFTILIEYKVVLSTCQLIPPCLHLHYNHHIQYTIHIVLLLAIPCSWLCLTFTLFLFFLSSLHHAGLTHKLSKLGWLVKENKQAFVALQSWFRVLLGWQCTGKLYSHAVVLWFRHPLYWSVLNGYCCLTYKYVSSHHWNVIY